jgi:ABC-type nitrate/sulfonate/bicarbonate transport system permease component
VTGAGLGYLIETSMASSIYPQLWAGVVLITLYSTVLYTAIAGVEKVVLTRFADLPT